MQHEMHYQQNIRKQAAEQNELTSYEPVGKTFRCRKRYKKLTQCCA